MTLRTLCILVVAGVLNSEAAHVPGACLGALCLYGRDYPKEFPLVERLGPGFVANGGNAHCYVTENGLYFMFDADSHTEEDRELDWIYIGSRPWPGCTESVKPREAIPWVSTPEGLQVGDPEARVRTLYGELPTFRVQRRGRSFVATFDPSPEYELLTRCCPAQR